MNGGLSVCQFEQRRVASLASCRYSHIVNELNEVTSLRVIPEGGKRSGKRRWKEGGSIVSSRAQTSQLANVRMN